ALAVAGIAIPPAFGLGADYSKDELKFHGTIGGQTPVHGYWVNWEDVFFYAGDAKAFNQFIDAYSKFKYRKLKVVLHVGPHSAQSPWDKAPRVIAADWSLYIWNTGYPLEGKVLIAKPGQTEVEIAPTGEPAPTRVDVWVGARLKLQDLRIPAGLDVSAASDAPPAGEIEKFLIARKTTPAEQTKIRPPSTPEPIRLTVELTDGSRLVGE